MKDTSSTGYLFVKCILFTYVHKDFAVESYKKHGDT